MLHAVYRVIIMTGLGIGRRWCYCRDDFENQLEGHDRDIPKRYEKGHVVSDCSIAPHYPFSCREDRQTGRATTYILFIARTEAE